MLDIERERELVAEEHDALDAYSTIVTTVADLVIPSVASLRVSHRTRNGRLAQGAGSAVTITPDGFLVTSAHVVDNHHKGVAAFADGREFDIVKRFWSPAELEQELAGLGWDIGAAETPNRHFLYASGARAPDPPNGV